MNMASTAANSGFKPNLTLSGAKHKRRVWLNQNSQVEAEK